MPVWICRAAFFAVFAVNIYCAVLFVACPQSYAGAYQLSGVPGIVAVRGMGIVFLMWNATYPPFIFNPARQKALGGVIIAQQAIGCVGEALILAALPSGFEILAQSITRFIIFDASGLLLEVAAFAVMRRSRHGLDSGD